MKSISKAALAVVSVVLVLQLLAVTLGWYSTYWWFDNITHFLGGVFLAFFVPLLYFRFRGRMPSIAIILIGVFVIGVGWEIFEYIWKDLVLPTMLVTPIDSGFDLIADMIGGVCGVFFVKGLKKRYNSSNAN